MLLSRTFLALAAFATTALALPSTNVGSDSLQYDAIGAARFEKRAPIEWFKSQIEKRKQAPYERRDSPIVPVPELSAASKRPVGKNYTGYKNPVPGEFAKNPVYGAISAFDFHSLNLGTHQEYIELDLFNYIVARFSVQDFKDVGLDEEDIHLLRFFAQQEVGHAVVLSNLLGAKAPKECQYQYPFNTLREALLFTEELTRWGESGVLGFLPSLDNRANAQILLQSITTESRQQYTMRQMLGAFPVPVWFETGVPQAYAWTLLSPYIKSCPSHNVPVGFSIFPKLTVQNQPDLAAAGKAAGGPAITHNISALTYPGKELHFEWDNAGKTQGPYNQKTEILAPNKEPKHAAFVSQYNVTYSDLYDVSQKHGKWYGKAKVPSGEIFPQNGTQSVINGTNFVALTHTTTFYTPLNLTLLTKDTIAGPAILQSG